MIISLLLVGTGLYFGGKLAERLRPAPPNEEADAPAPPAPARRRAWLLGKGRQEHLAEMQQPEHEGKNERVPDPEEQALHQDLALGATTVVLVAGGSVLPVLYLLALPFMVYGAGRLVGYTWEAWQKKEPIGMTLLDSTVVIGTMLFGPWLAPASSLLSSAVARYLLRLTEDKSQARVTALFDSQKHKVWMVRDGVQIEVPLEHVQEGDVLVVDAGALVPVDGVIVEGIGRVDQQALTGESHPRDLAIGDKVLAAFVLLEGRLHIRVERAGAETLAARLVAIINNSRHFSDDVRSRGQLIVDTWSLPTLGLGLATMPVLGVVPGLAVMESSFGSSLRYSGPLSVLNYLQIASETGVLIKDGRALERLSAIDTVVFDKTGTLTRDQQVLGAITVYSGYQEDEVLALAAAAEQRQEHPIARAIREAAAARQLHVPPLEEAAIHPGRGLSVRVEGRRITLGSRRLLESEGVTLMPHGLPGSGEGSEVFVAIDGVLAGAMRLTPEIRPEAKALVAALHARGLHVAIISGDSNEPTQQLASQLGIDTYYAEVLPAGKADIIEQMRQQGRNVCFVGDGINDALALRAADVAVSLRGATTVATDAASIIIMRGSLAHLHGLFSLSDEFEKNMAINTVLTVLPGAISIFGVYFLGFGILTANLLYNSSIVLGIINGMLPAVKLRDFGEPQLPASPSQPAAAGVLPAMGEQAT